MIRFFQKSHGADRNSTEHRLAWIERKLNILLALVAGLLIVETLSLFTSISSLLIPSPTTIALIAVVAIACGYFFRKQIPRLLKHTFLPPTESSRLQPDKTVSDFDDAAKQ